MARVKTKVRTFRRAAKAAAKSHCGGQGFHSIGFPEEQRLVSEAWVTKSKSTIRIPTLLTKPCRGPWGPGVPQALD
jgi:hypothetical protein